MSEGKILSKHHEPFEGSWCIFTEGGKVLRGLALVGEIDKDSLEELLSHLHDHHHDPSSSSRSKKWGVKVDVVSQ